MKHYLRIGNDYNFDFLIDEINEIKETDVFVAEEDFKTFLKRQSEGKQYRLKEKRPLNNKGGLFDYVEEYIQEYPKEEKKEELSLEDRITALENAFLESM